MMEDLVERAIRIARECLKEDTRSDGTPFLGHPEAVAAIVRDEMGLPSECEAAVYLHEASRAHRDEYDAMMQGEAFPADVLTMVEGLNRISTIKPRDTRLEAENYKKLIVQYSTDPRVAVIKIADRLEVMRSLDIFPKSSRDQKVLETLMLYIPLAHQLGLYNIKSELENIYFRYSEPEQYRFITNKLKSTERDRERLTDEFIRPLEAKLKEAGIIYKLKVRTKTAYSIHKKMLSQGVPFEGVYDVFAIRFIIDCSEDRQVEKDLCWKVFSYVTEEYEPDTSRLRDWVTNPKPNGYESLHITVKNRSGAYLEVQIRTRRMDDEAENGAASHWSYKGIRHEQQLDRWLKSVRYTLEHPFDTRPEDLPKPPASEIFVFTPTGELKILPEGATVLDFAFSIHTGLGSRCTGGKINGKLASIKDILRTGDLVEILTSKNQKPTQDWLGWVVTSKARTRIKQEIGEAEHRKAMEGREILERRLKNWKLSFPDDMRHDFLKQNKYSSVNAFFADIADGRLDPNIVKEFILVGGKARETAEEGKTISDWKGSSSGGGDDILVLNAKSVKGLDYRMAKCCNPVFGDDVFGFVTRSEGIKIHRMSCPNAARLMENYPYRIQKVAWAETPSSGDFQCTLRIIAEGEQSVINKIMEVTASFKASIRAFNVADGRDGTFDISMKLLVPSNMELDKVVSQIGALRNVIRVRRI